MAVLGSAMTKEESRIYYYFLIFHFPFFLSIYIRIQPQVRINNKKSWENYGTRNPGQSEYDINL